MHRDILFFWKKKDRELTEIKKRVWNNFYLFIYWMELDWETANGSKENRGLGAREFIAEEAVWIHYAIIRNLYSFYDA